LLDAISYGHPRALERVSLIADGERRRRWGPPIGWVDTGICGGK
jgi:hypothetical protein